MVIPLSFMVQMEKLKNFMELLESFLPGQFMVMMTRMLLCTTMTKGW